jgi:hypothetical protein
MAAKDNAWRSFQEEMKRKRTKVGAKDRKRVKKSELVVKRLSAEVSGKANDEAANGQQTCATLLQKCQLRFWCLAVAFHPDSDSEHSAIHDNQEKHGSCSE